MERYKLGRKIMIELFVLLLVIKLIAVEEGEIIVPSDSTLVTMDSLAYSSDSTYYFANEKKLFLMGNAKINYQKSSIIADTIYMNMKNKNAETFGKSIIKDNTQTIIGQKVTIDIDSKNGLIKQGISEFDKGFYYGDEIRKISKDTYDLDNGYFTTCEAKVPHFYIRANKMRIFQKDKIAAKPVFFYVNNLPIFAIPFATFSIKKGRHTGFLMPEPGYNSIDGKFIRDITFYTYLDDFADARFALDFMQKTGWETRFTTNYLRRYKYNGGFFGRLKKSVNSVDNYTYEWYFNYNHHHTFINDKKLDMNLTFLSSKQIWESSQDIDERLSEKVTSSLSYKLPVGKRSLFIKANYTDDLKNQKKSITLPNISYSLPSKPIYEIFLNESEIDKSENWWKNFSYSYKVNALHSGTIDEHHPSLSAILYQNKKDSLGTYINQHNAGMKHTSSISYSQKVGGWLSLSQYYYGNEAWFDRDKAGNSLVRSFDYSTSTSGKFSMYGIRSFGDSFVSAVRHIITPNVSFSYTPDYSENYDKYYSFSSISTKSGAKSRRVGLSLSNLWQLKLNMKDGKVKKINDFLSINSRVNYNLEGEKGEEFSDISHSINVSSAKYNSNLVNLDYRISGNLTQDPYDFDIGNWSYSQSLSFSGSQNYYDYFPVEKNDILNANLFTQNNEDFNEIKTIADWEKQKENSKWKLNFAHSYSKNEISNDVSSSIRSSLTLNVTKNWFLTYNNYYDIEDAEIRSQSVRILRDLHCWKISFNWTRSNDYWSYYLKLFNIKLPDSLKFKTKDHSN